MKISSVVVFGGTGFIGRHLVARLVQAGLDVRVPTRRLDRAKHLTTLPTVEVVETDLSDAALARLVRGCGAAINLVGILHARRARPYGPEFKAAHVELPRRIAAACAAQGVPRLLHMSALGASVDGPSMYQRSKADGEAAARTGEGVAATIFRPSVVFGQDDHLLSLLAHLNRRFPVLPLAGANVDFQPVYVGDVAEAFLRVLADRTTMHQVYQLGGPQIYALGDLARIVGRHIGHPRPVFDMPGWLAYPFATLCELLPGTPLISRDNLDSMKVDNVIDPAIGAHTASALGLHLTPLEAVLPHVLAPTMDMDLYRARARR
jgi:NADH dehydrogenase